MDNKTIKEKIERAMRVGDVTAPEQPYWGYSIVGLRSDLPGSWLRKPFYRLLLRIFGDEGIPIKCVRCQQYMYVMDLVKWRNTGAGAMCNVCAGPRIKIGSIVADDNLEIIPLGKDYEPIFPERMRVFYEEWEKGGIVKRLVKKGEEYVYEPSSE